jgi:hypothetical protein
MPVETEFSQGVVEVQEPSVSALAGRATGAAIIITTKNATNVRTAIV